MNALQELEQRILTIEKRNRRVELDKQWETSWIRRSTVIVFTYLAIGLYLQIIQVKDPWLNAIVPSVGFLLSTLTLGIIKQSWLRKKIR